jgi:fatty-acyl-CoA synthase
MSSGARALQAITGISRKESSSNLFLAQDLVARHARLRPSHAALVSLATGERLSYLTLDARIARCAGLLERALSGPGARVALLARNTVHHVALFYASARAGVVYQPLNWRLPGAELKLLIDDAEPELLIYQAEFEGEVKIALGAQRACKLMRIAPDGDALEAALERAEPSSASVKDPQAPCTLLYTSGTTGRPKGVIITPYSAFFSALNFACAGELSSAAVMLCETPLFHVAALMAAQHASLFAGATYVMNNKFAPKDTLRFCVDPALGVTHYFGVPQMAQALRDDASYTPNALSGLKAVFTGGAPMPPKLGQDLLDDGVSWVNGYGSSEAGTVFGMPLDRAMAHKKLGSCGITAPAMAVRLVGLDGRDVKQGDTGEIWLSGPAVTPGYWNQPQATAVAFENGWLRTGDAARQDEDGYYYIVDRWKDMYISGGENVYPAEVEGALCEIPGVRDAAVIGVPDPRWGEAGCAYLALEPGAEVTPSAVAKHCAKRLARYKHPAHVRVIDQIPRTATGKILKDVLRRRFADEPSSAGPAS